MTVDPTGERFPELPRASIPALPAPDSAFDAVLRRAAARRLRRAGLAGALSLALVAGAVAVGSWLPGGSGDDSLVAASATPSSAEPAAVASDRPYLLPPVAPAPPSAAAAPEPAAAAEAAPTPTPAAAQPASSGPTSAPPVPPPPTRTYPGRVVDGAGQPVAGAWLHTYEPGAPLRAVRIADDGTYVGTCDGPRELIAMWDLSLASSLVQPAGMRNLAATWVGGGTTAGAGSPVSCGGTTPVTTVLQPGATLTGRITYVDSDGRESAYPDGGNPGGGLLCQPLGIQLDGPQCASWAPQGGRYLFTGLPGGTYRLWDMYTPDHEVTLPAGGTVELDWYVDARPR